MIRVRCYYRCASANQPEGWGIEVQDRLCRTFIATRPDWQRVGQPYLDEAWSGLSVNRPAFQQMLQDARTGQFDILVCHKLDRLSRSLLHVTLILDELQQSHVTFASATESVDAITAHRSLVHSSLAFAFACNGGVPRASERQPARSESQPLAQVPLPPREEHLFAILAELARQSCQGAMP